MYCSSCGKYIDADAKFCDHCGAKQDDDLTMEDMGHTSTMSIEKPAQFGSEDGGQTGGFGAVIGNNSTYGNYGNDDQNYNNVGNNSYNGNNYGGNSGYRGNNGGQNDMYGTQQFDRQDNTISFAPMYPRNDDYDDDYDMPMPASYEKRHRNDGKASASNSKAIIITLSSCVAVLLILCAVMFFVLKKNSKPPVDDSSKKPYDAVVIYDESEDSKTVTVPPRPEDPKDESSEDAGTDEESSDAESKADESIAESSKADVSKADSSNADTSKADAKDDKSFKGLQAKLDGKQQVDIQFVSSDISNYPNVKTYFTVKDKSGNSVVLKDPEFAIQEKVTDGEMLERNVKSFEQLKGREGVSFDLVADKSGSMSGDLPSMQNIMSSFVDTLDYNTGDSAELIAFDSYVMYMCTYTNNTGLLKNGINNMTTYGETALYDALYDAISNSKNRGGAKCVIAFTDGADNQSYHTVDEVIALANSYNVPIFIIGTYSGDASVYERITYNTGGTYWYIGSISDLSGVLSTIYSQEKDMYCLEYVSDPNADPYASRKISCVFEDSTVGAQVDADFTPHKVVEQVKHDSRYEVITEKCSWTQANAECIAMGGHLVTINSQEEMDKITQLADSNGLKYVWMGGYTSVRGNSAYGHWITGESFDYQNWYEGEPSRTDHDGVDEMYLMLWNVNGWSWNDQRNDPAADYSYFGQNNNMGYICEYEY